MATSVNQKVGALANRPYILAHSGVPVAPAPNGTIATNGIVTLGTALPATYSGGIWLRFPADAVVGGLAGMYWAVMTSTTQGQVYTNFSDPASEFIPRIPSGTLVAAVGSNAAYTQSTAELTMVNVTIPAGALGLYGSIRHKAVFFGSSGGNKTPRAKFGGTTVISGSNFTTAGTGWSHSVFNRGLANSQYANNGATGDAGTAGARAPVAADTSGAVSYTATLQLAAATDAGVLEAFMVEVLPS